MISRNTKLLLATGGFAFSIYWCYHSERHVMDAAGNRPATVRSTIRHLFAPKSRTAAIDRLEELRHAGGRVGFRPRDSDECWSIIRGFSVEDIKAYLGDLPTNTKSGSNAELTSMLFYRWAQLDPVAAGNAVLLPPYQNLYYQEPIYAVATAFLDRDLDGALRWAASSGSNDAKSMIENYAGRLLAIQDPQHALDRAAAEFPSAVPSIIQTLFQRMGDTEESRREFLTNTLGKVSTENWSKSINDVAFKWSNKDPEELQALLAEFERAGIPADLIKSFEGSVLAASIYENSAQGLYQMHLDSAASPDQKLDYFGYWLAHNPDQATAWAVETNNADLISSTVKKQSLQLLQNGWQPGGDDNHASMQGLYRQFKSWRQHEPEAANAWFESMPSDLRADLNKTADELIR